MKLYVTYLNMNPEDINTLISYNNICGQLFNCIQSITLDIDMHNIPIDNNMVSIYLLKSIQPKMYFKVLSWSIITNNMPV